jgi:predicted dehydrogenase
VKIGINDDFLWNKSMTLKIAFTGTGYISKIHAKAAQALTDVELVAVVNHRLESMASFASEFNIPRQYKTVTDLLEDGDVDGLIVSTPNYLHASESIAALNAGVHVMVEKPMAMNAAEAQTMLQASQKGDSLLMVAHCWRFDEEVVWLKEQIDNNRIGDIVRTKGYGVHVNWGPSGWFTQKKLAGGGALADMGIHALDTARFLLSDPQPVSVYAKLSTHYKEFDVDDTGLIIVNWDNGVSSYIESGWWQPYADGPEASTQLYGLNGMANLYPTGLLLTSTEEKKAEKIDSGFPASRDPHCPQAMYNSQIAYFAECIKNNQTPSPGGIEGLINAKVIDAAYGSSRSGKVINIESR